MQGLAVPVVLEDKDTWTFRIIRIVFNRHSSATPSTTSFISESKASELLERMTLLVSDTSGRCRGVEYHGLPGLTANRLPGRKTHGRIKPWPQK
jgi:hypothetical protein